MATEAKQSSCENPSFPSWMWRYNRNKRLSRFEPWFIRVERWPPHYRHMGVHDGFKFDSTDANERTGHFQEFGLNYAHELALNRHAGFGNAALGNSPGPAPPRFIVYQSQSPYPRDDLYKVNEIHNISHGVSLLDHSIIREQEMDLHMLPLDPRQYLQETLGQTMEFPGTFPHRNKPIPSVGKNPPRVCTIAKGSRDPMAQWLNNVKNRQQAASNYQYGIPLNQHICPGEEKVCVDFEGLRPPAL